MRQFSVIQPTTVAGVTDSSATIRPFATNADGFGTLTGTVTAPTDLASAMTALTPEALSITATSCPNLNNSEFLTARFVQAARAELRDGISRRPTACPTRRSARSRPRTTTRSATSSTRRPRSSVRRTRSFATAPTEASAPRRLAATRKPVLYVATNDGLLHAFWADETKLENNEMWAMMPPAVMPKLLSTYPSSHALLLDGCAGGQGRRLGSHVRELGDASCGTRCSSRATAPYAQGYYGVDVTNPDRAGIAAAPCPRTRPVGPVFRWQLTKMPSTNHPIFGAQSATPAITTLFVDPGDGGGAREIGVAILPGGSNGSPTSSLPCDRDTDTNDAPLSTASTAMPGNNAFPARTQVQCWSGNGRSLSIVRLDTGEIIRTFIRKTDAPAPVIAANKRRPTPLDSPMTGVPVVYPTDVGAIAQRVFIGDQDGTMWRFDLSNQNPDNWKGEFFVDSYNTNPNVVTTTPWQDGQPIAVAPTVAIDDVGNVVVAFRDGRPGDVHGHRYELRLLGDGEAREQRRHDLAARERELVLAVHGWPARFRPDGRVRRNLVFCNLLGTGEYCGVHARHAELWGRDFEIPRDSTALNLGGVPRFNPLLVSPAPDFY